MYRTRWVPVVMTTGTKCPPPVLINRDCTGFLDRVDDIYCTQFISRKQTLGIPYPDRKIPLRYIIINARYTNPIRVVFLIFLRDIVVIYTVFYVHTRLKYR